jgi:hypothetical protein
MLTCCKSSVLVSSPSTTSETSDQHSQGLASIIPKLSALSIPHLTLRSSIAARFSLFLLHHTPDPILVRDVTRSFRQWQRFRNRSSFRIRFSWSIRTAYLPSCRYVGLLPSLQTPLLLLRERYGIRRDEQEKKGRMGY